MLDFVVNVKPNAAAATFLDYSQDLEKVLRRVVTSATQ
jgi:RNase P protein component